MFNSISDIGAAPIFKSEEYAFREDVFRTFLNKVGIYLPHNTASNPKRQ
jgi:hypothetical protein